MKNALFILLVVLTPVLLAGCSGEQKTDAQQQGSAAQKMEGGDHAAHANMDMGSNEPSDQSIYNVNSSWKTRSGTSVKLNSLHGKVQVLAMVYTHCEYACPRILADMKRIRDAISDEALAQTHFTIVSIDPKRDTPERLQTFAAENDLSKEQWTLLNGQQGDVLELAALLGFKYKRVSETDFTHSNMITILNKEGEVSYQRQKLADQPTEAVNAIEKLSSAKSL